MVVEADLAIGAGVIPGTVLLIAFGLDTIVALKNGAILLWRLMLQMRGGAQPRVEAAEQRARWIVAAALVALCAYVLVMSAYGLVADVRPESSPVSIGVSLAAAIVMPWLFWRKRRLASALHSAALR